MTKKQSPHEHYDAATQTMKHLKKFSDAFALVRGAVPDQTLSKQLAAYAEAVETIRFIIPKIADPKRTYEPCEFNEAINSEAKRNKKFRDALNLTGFVR